MPIPVKKRLKHYRGDDFRYQFRVEDYIDPDNPSAGTEPRDLTTYTWVIEADPDLPTATVENSLDATGLISVYVSADDLDDGQQDRVSFDVQLIDSDNFRRTYVQVVLTLKEQVS